MKLSDWLRGLVGIEIIEEDVEDEASEDLNSIKDLGLGLAPKMMKTVSLKKRESEIAKLEQNVKRGKHSPGSQAKLNILKFQDPKPHI